PPPPPASVSSSSFPSTTHPASQPYLPASVIVSVMHSPLHIGCFLQSTVPGNSDSREQPRRSQAQAGGGQVERCCAFSLASPACARVFPLRRCDWGGGGGGGAGAALFAAAAAVEGGGGAGEGSAVGRVSAEEVPQEQRLRYRLLAHSLAEVLWEQLLLDVTGSGGVFTLGDTSGLIGATLAAAADETKRVAQTSERGAVPSFGGAGEGGGGGGHGSGLGGARGSAHASRRDASVVLVDRTLDLAAAASRGGSLLQRILSSIARTGSLAPPCSYTSTAPAPAFEADWCPTALAHQLDVGVVLPTLAPGLGLPVSPAVTAAAAAAAAAALDDHTGDDHQANVGGGGGGGGGGGHEAGRRPGRPRLLAMKALAGFSWPAPPSLCHPGSAEASGVVHATACLGEEGGQAALILALERCVYENGCVPPPSKRRGMGSSIMALVTSLARGNPRAGGMSGDRVCFRCRSVVQVALAAMEAHQRTSAPAGSKWAETVAAERAQLQQLRDGGTAEVVMDQLCDTLRAPPSLGNTTTGAAQTGPVSDALLLALRGLSLGGGSIGAEEASSFRKAWVSRMLAGGFREEGSGVPPGVAQGVEKIFLRGHKVAAAAAAGAADNAAGGNPFGGGGGGEGKGQGEGEGAGVLLELEDIARERTQRLREAAASRSHLHTRALRDLAYEPYTFVASAAIGSEGAGVNGSGGGGGGEGDGGGGGGGGGGGDEEGWDDWGDDAGDGVRG
ncbi:unnamed protein product, partial [Laminaria digitata]